MKRDPRHADDGYEIPIGENEQGRGYAHMKPQGCGDVLLYNDGWRHGFVAGLVAGAVTVIVLGMLAGGIL